MPNGERGSYPLLRYRTCHGAILRLIGLSAARWAVTTAIGRTSTCLRHRRVVARSAARLHEQRGMSGQPRDDAVVIRSLSQRESAALGVLLSRDFVGAEALRRQAESATASGDGLIIDLIVDPSLPAAVVLSRVPVEAPVIDAEANHGGLLLFVEDGRLSGLEYWWTSDAKPDDFPDSGWIGEPVARN
jgi:hypothetical protein